MIDGRVDEPAGTEAAARITLYPTNGCLPGSLSHCRWALRLQQPTDVLSMSPTSDPMPHAAQEQAGDAAAQPSSAIFTGADAIMQLMEDEKSKLSNIYLHALKTLEDDFHATKLRSERAIAAAEGRLKEQSAKMQELEIELRRAVQSAEGSRRKLVMTRAENEQMKAALVAAGFEYVDGHIVFSPKTAQIVDDFVSGARKQSEAMMTVTSPTLRSATV